MAVEYFVAGCGRLLDPTLTPHVLAVDDMQEARSKYINSLLQEGISGAACSLKGNWSFTLCWTNDGSMLMPRALLCIMWK